MPKPSKFRALLPRVQANSAPKVIDHYARNARLLRAYSKSSSAEEALRWRNALVTANLPLVYSVANRLSSRVDLPREDLAQVGIFGLIKAVESFDFKRTSSLSSYAIKFIHGAILHELRDRQSLVRIPRQLWELRQRANQQQERWHRQGKNNFTKQRLAGALKCDPTQLNEALDLHNVTAMCSLDAPLTTARQQGSNMHCLLDQLADPRSLQQVVKPEKAEAPIQTSRERERLRWLRQQLKGLDSIQFQLVLNRSCSSCTWVELGRKLGIHPRQAQRRHDAALNILRKSAAAWTSAQPG